MNESHLTIYLSDHLAGSEAAVALAQRCRDANPDTPVAAYLGTFLDELGGERALLMGLLERCGGEANTPKRALGWLGEKVARLKLDAPLGNRGALSRFEALEALLLGVRGKLALWHALRATVADDPRLHHLNLGVLIGQAERQLEVLEGYRLEAAREAFS